MKPDIFSMPVHPAAQVFPMLPADELAELADDIKTNGLTHPIVVKDGLLIDGRNRREGCRIAGVKPDVVELNGQDPVAYILSSNITRRHLTKGQRAMAVAMIFPQSERKGGQGKTDGTNSAETAGLTYRRLAEARTVLKWAPELSDAVLGGAQGLDAAYEVAQSRKVQAEAPQKRLDVLRASDPDMADKVVEGDLDLEDAEGAARSRREREREKRQGLYGGLKAVDEWKFLFSGANRAFLVATCRSHPQELSSSNVRELLSEVIAVMQATLKELQ